jgi:hypothetical protein
LQPAPKNRDLHSADEIKTGRFLMGRIILNNLLKKWKFMVTYKHANNKHQKFAISLVHIDFLYVLGHLLRV